MSVDDVVKFHSEHYGQRFAVCGGDVKADDVELAIRTVFDGSRRRALNPVPPCLKAQSRHFPPIVHEWPGRFDQTSACRSTASGSRDDGRPKNEYLLLLDVPAVPHPLPVFLLGLMLQQLHTFSFHLFAKRPVEDHDAS